LFLGHNLPTSNARRPMKGFKDADIRLVHFKRKKGWNTTWTFFSGPHDVIQKSFDLP